MEFGDHCSFDKCSRLDFLPLICERCRKIFCKDHNLPEQHGCISSTITVTSNNPESVSSKATELLKSYSCSIEGCRKKELVEILCPHCNGSFCLQHRHQTDHNCSALASTPKSNPKTSTVTSLSTKDSTSGQQRGASKVKKPLSDKAARMEAKVRLMKLKMKAEGSPSIPQAERLFFFVRLPSSDSSSSSPSSGICHTDRPMYFSREWSVGKVIDFVAQKHKLTNNNHLPLSTERLVLQDVTGKSFDMKKTLNSLQDTLCSGSVIVLKYEPRNTS